MSLRSCRLFFCFAGSACAVGAVACCTPCSRAKRRCMCDFRALHEHEKKSCGASVHKLPMRREAGRRRVMMTERSGALLRPCVSASHTSTPRPSMVRATMAQTCGSAILRETSFFFSRPAPSSRASLAGSAAACIRLPLATFSCFLLLSAATGLFPRASCLISMRAHVSFY